MKNAIKLFTLMVTGVSMIFLSSCGKDEGSITPITIDFSSSATTVAENAGAQSVTIVFDAEAPIDATFDLAISGTAVYGEDFTTSPDGATGTATVDVLAGDALSTFTFTPIDNENVDGDKTVIFTISGSADGVELGSSLVYTVTIDDEEGPSNVDFAAAENSVSEDAGAVTVTLNFGTTTTAPGTVDVTMTGDASAVTTDPAATADVFTVTSASGVDEVTFTVTPVNDDAVTADREISFTLGNATNGIELGNSQQTYVLTVTEDDPNTIESLRADFEANGSSTLAGGKIQGVVTTDKSNLTGRNLVMQDASGGIVVRFNDNNVDFDLGDEISVDLTGAELSDFNGLVQVSGIELTAATEIGSGTLPTPIVVTVAELLTDDYQSQVVTVSDVAVQGADGVVVFGSFQAETLYNVGGDEVRTFVRGGSQLEGEVIPTGAGTVTGVATQTSGGVELTLRSISDFALTTVADLTVSAVETDFGQVENGLYSAVKTYTVTLASGTLQSDVTITASSNFEISLDGTTFGESVTVPSADLSSIVNLSVRFYANTGFNGVIDGFISFESFGVATINTMVMGEETGNVETSILMSDEFDYGTTAGDLTTLSGGNWVNHSGSGAVGYTENGLTAPTGFISTNTGGALTLTGSNGEDVNRSFPAQASNAFYTAAVVNVSEVSGENYFYHLKDDEFGFVARVFAKDDGSGNLNFGISNSSSGQVYSTTNYSYNTSYVLVIKFDPSTGQADLFVLDAVSGTEPAADASTGAGSAKDNVSSVAFRQSGGIPTCTIDAVYVSTDWAGLLAGG